MKLTAPAPKSRELADFIARKIESEELVPGERLQSLRDLSTLFNVSNKVAYSAYSILAKRGLVVQEVGRGTFVRDRASPTGSVVFGLLTGFREQDIESYFELAASEASLHQGLCVPIPFANHLPWRESLEVLTAQNPVARLNPVALLVDVGPWADPDEIAALAAPTPVCFIHRWQWKTQPTHPAVVVDFANMREQAFRHLIDRGHERIAVVGPFRSPRGESERYLRAGARAAGLAYPSAACPYLCYRDFQNAPERITKVFGGKYRPTAILGTTDHIAAVFRDQLIARYPRLAAIDIIGAYDTEWSRQPGRAFPSFSIDFRAIFRAALDRMVAPSPKGENLEWVRARLVERKFENNRGKTNTTPVNH